MFYKSKVILPFIFHTNFTQNLFAYFIFLSLSLSIVIHYMSFSLNTHYLSLSIIYFIHRKSLIYPILKLDFSTHLWKIGSLTTLTFFATSRCKFLADFWRKNDRGVSSLGVKRGWLDVYIDPSSYKTHHIFFLILWI